MTELKAVEIFTNDEKKLLIEAICDKQIRKIVKDPDAYNSQKYTELEALKIKIKDM
jgi:hypothetical protein